jgi:protein-tyrosine phosphatase
MSITLPVAAERKSGWDGLHNARDLGGIDTADGPTRFGVVVRSEAPTLLTAEGRRQLDEYGVNAYLDLRSDEEAAEEPSPFALERGYRRVAILDQEAMHHVRGMHESEDLMHFMLFKRAELVGEALLNLLDLSVTGGVLVHCRAGKDRTGIMAALLLSNAGVSWDAVADEHARSRLHLEPLFAYWASRAQSDEERALASMRKFVPTRESMLVTLGEIAARHGAVPQYLRHIGLTADEVTALRLLLIPRRSANEAA